MCSSCDIENQGRAARIAGRGLAESPYLDCPPLLVMWVIGWEQEDEDLKQVVFGLTHQKQKGAQL